MNNRKTVRSFRLDDDDIDRLEKGVELWNRTEKYMTGGKHTITEFLSKAIQLYYDKLAVNTIDSGTTERFARIIDNELEVRLSNLENMLDSINITSLKHYKFFELFAVSVLKDIDGIAQKNSDLFGGDVEKTKDYFINTFFPSILKNGSTLSSIVDEYMLKLENGEIESNDDIDEFDN